jgi:hypothetical protein
MAPNMQRPSDYQSRRPREDDDVNESWKKIIAKVGVYGAVGLWLGYLLVGEVRTSLLRIERSLDGHVLGTQNLTSGIDKLVNLNLQQCINEARDAPARNACVQAQWNPAGPLTGDQPPARSRTPTPQFGQ